MPSPTFVPSWERLGEPCTKTRFTSKNQAHKSARKLTSEKGLGSTPMRPYYHQACGCWHLTTKSNEASKRENGRVRKGSKTLQAAGERAQGIRGMVPVVLPMAPHQHAAFASSRYGRDDGGEHLIHDLEGGQPTRLKPTDDALGGSGPIVRLHPVQQARLEALAARAGMDLGSYVVRRLFG